MEIRVHCDVHGKKHMIDNVQHGCDMGILYQSVGAEHDDQTAVFNAHGTPFTDHVDDPADPLREKPVKRIIEQKQQCNLAGRISEFLDHEECGKNNEYLSPCTREKYQRIVQPVAAP